jgi:hypothetical protein
VSFVVIVLTYPWVIPWSHLLPQFTLARAVKSDYPLAMWAHRVIAALFVSTVVFAPRTGSADPATYEPGVDPSVGFNLISWSNFGAAGEGVWEAAVLDIYDHGFRAVSISPLRFVDLATGRVRLSDGTTTGPDLAHLSAAVARAKNLGMTVTVNPFVTPDQFSIWRGQMNFSGSARAQFWSDYQSYLVDIASMAEAQGADRMTVGTELKEIALDPAHNAYWTNAIAAVAAMFHGSLGYSSGWDEYRDANLTTTVWENPHIDFIGVDAYFPLATDAEAGGLNAPSAAILETRWDSVLDNPAGGFNHGVLAFAAARKSGAGMPVVMTEHGTIPYDKATVRPYSTGPGSGPSDPYEQRNDYDALMRAVDQRAAAPVGDGRLEEIHVWHWGMPGADGSLWFLDPEGDDVVHGAKGAQFLAGFVNGAIPDPGSPQDKDRQTCINALNVSSAKLCKAQDKEVLNCVSDFARSRLLPGMTTESCILADRRSRVAAAKDRTTAEEARRCTTETPDFGFSGAAIVNEAAIAAPIDLAHDIFGASLDSTLAREISGQAMPGCQQAVLRGAQRCLEARVQEFNRCKKTGLRSRIDSTERLAECLHADPNGRIARACDGAGGSPDGIRAAITERCVTAAVDLGAAFPPCSAGDAETLHACLATAAQRQSCRLLSAADALGATCD